MSRQIQVYVISLSKMMNNRFESITFKCAYLLKKIRNIYIKTSATTILQSTVVCQTVLSIWRECAAITNKGGVSQLGLYKKVNLSHCRKCIRYPQQHPWEKDPAMFSIRTAFILPALLALLVVNVESSFSGGKFQQLFCRNIYTVLWCYCYVVHVLL